MTGPVTALQVAFPGRVDRRRYIVVLTWSVGAFAAGVGSLGVIRNAWLQAIPESEFPYSIAFGICFASFVGLRFYCHVRFETRASSALRTLVRQQSRLVYLTLYALIGTNQILAALNDRSLETSATRLQGYLVAGIVTLVLVRVLAIILKNPAHHLARHRREGGVGPLP